MKSEYAKHRGVKPSAVSNWNTKGLLVFAADPSRPGKQLIDVEKTDLVLNGTVDQTRGRPRSGDMEAAAQFGADAPAPSAPRSVPMTAEAAARLEEVQERTLGRRIENERNLGRLISLADAERRAADRGRMIRERVNSLVRAHAERIAAESDPRVVVSILQTEFDALFNRVADEIEAEARAEADVDATLATIDAQVEAEGEDEAVTA